MKNTRRYAWIVKVGEKGQFVLPKEAREAFNITPGQSVLLLGDTKRGLALVCGEKAEKLQDRLFGAAFAEEGDDEECD